MKKIELSYESYKGGIIIADYSHENLPRFTGQGMQWINQPIIDEPFENKEQAEIAAREYFGARQI